MAAWELDEKLLDEMVREIALDAEASAKAAEQALRLAEILVPAVEAMCHTGAMAKQIAAVLRYFAAIGEDQGFDD